MKYLRLFESYKSQKDLEYFTKVILERIADETFDNIESSFYRVKDFPSVKLKDFNPNHYDTLKEFIKEWGELTVKIISKNMTVKGYYDDTNLDIVIKLKQYTLTQINEFIISEKWKPDENDDLFKQHIETHIYADYSDTLLHELQHAYDDWRSNGKAFDIPTDYINNISNYNKKDTIYKQRLNNLESGEEIKYDDDLKDEDIDFIGKHHTDYLNFKHEVDARFTQAIKKIKWYEVDKDEPMGKTSFIYKMLPFKDILRTFKAKMYPFNALSDTEQKRLIKKLAKFYQLEKDEMILKNEKEK